MQHDVVGLENLEEQQLRVDLAAALRLAARSEWHEGVANHFSAAVSPDGKKFLVNPRWKHFSLARASDLLLVDADDPETMNRPDAPDPSAWVDPFGNSSQSAPCPRRIASAPALRNRVGSLERSDHQAD